MTDLPYFSHLMRAAWIAEHGVLPLERANVRTSEELRSTAFHEAGHVAAHYFLQVPFKYVTIIESEGTLGHVHGEGWPRARVERIKTASYCGPAGFIDAPTCRWTEKRVMMYLAGGFANERAMGVESTEVGSGWAKAYDDDAAVLAAEHGYNTDMANAPALVEHSRATTSTRPGPT